MSSSRSFQLMIADVELRVGGNRTAALNLRPAVDFLRRATDSRCPANSIVVLESRSSLSTGAIFYGKREGEAAYSTLPDVVNSFLGTDMLAAMANGNRVACQMSLPEQPRWFQEGAFSRGGWRGLVLVAEGPTVRVPPRKDEAIRLVDR